MADQTTQKAIEQQPKTTPAGANAKAPADTGDRELSDADLDRVSGGAGGAVRRSVRGILDSTPAF